MCNKFDVKWKRICYVCQNPLDIELIPQVSSHEFIERFLTFRAMYPFNLTGNASMYKIYGRKARKVCIPCYATEPEKIHINTLRKREIGGRILKTRYGSKSHTELYNWFELFNRFINRPEINDIVNDPITRISPECLRLFDVLHRRIYHTESQI